MEEDHDFTEFEGIELQYRRALLPWWIWLFLVVFILLNLAFLVKAIFDGGPLGYGIFGLQSIIHYPYSGAVSILVLALFIYTTISLWLEKKNAVLLGRISTCIGLGICLAVLVVSMLQKHFYIRVEMVPLVDFLFRLTEIRRDWKYKSVSRYEME